MTSAIKQIVEKADDVPVKLVIISEEDSGFETWAVEAPGQLETGKFFYTQPNEQRARDFYSRLVCHLRKNKEKQ